MGVKDKVLPKHKPQTLAFMVFARLFAKKAKHFDMGNLHRVRVRVKVRVCFPV